MIKALESARWVPVRSMVISRLLRWRSCPSIVNRLPTKSKLPRTGLDFFHQFAGLAAVPVIVSNPPHSDRDRDLGQKRARAVLLRSMAIQDAPSS